ncbi:MAG: ABC transporter ATP-binding protein [Marinilabiliaceae bacterium]|jgi:ABC-type multidrug transport system ATPase subunit|nr:ABC transporter ATP-binding protein [Marinilabiliaceae bacterium]
MIKINNISKSFGDTVALKDISLEVNESELFGLIGPDGAGKTTLFRIIATLMLPDTGKAEVMGLDCIKDYRELRKHIGYMPGRFSLYQDLTVAENLKFYATVFGTTIDENYHLIKDIYSHIEPFKKRQAGKLSGGMKQKLALCCALIHAPRLIILDEPTTGVDAVSRSEFWEMLRRLKDEKITLIVSTPYMDEAAKCDRVALLQEGRILRQDKPARVPDSFGEKLYAVKAENKYRLITLLKSLPMVTSVNPFGDSVHITSTEDKPADILQGLLQKELSGNIEISEIEPGIEDTFLKLMQER